MLPSNIAIADDGLVVIGYMMTAQLIQVAKELRDITGTRRGKKVLNLDVRHAIDSQALRKDNLLNVEKNYGIAFNLVN